MKSDLNYMKSMGYTGEIYINVQAVSSHFKLSHWFSVRANSFFRFWDFVAVSGILNILKDLLACVFRADSGEGAAISSKTLTT